MPNIIQRNWNGRTIRQREDGFICLTDMAKANGKEFRDWNRLDSTQEYLKLLYNRRCAESNNGKWIEIIQGGTPEKQGTWGHRKVALRFAQWLNPAFAIQVDDWVEELLTKGSVSLKEPDPQPEPLNNVYIKRLTFSTNRITLPQNYWCIFDEVSKLMRFLETHFEGEINRFDLVDGSVGIRWGRYRKSEILSGKDWPQKIKEYKPSFSRPSGESEGKMLPCVGITLLSDVVSRKIHPSLPLDVPRRQI